MLKELTCIMCPIGCDLEIEVTDKEIISITGNNCPKGRDYAWQEITNPMRNIATSLLVNGGDQPLVSIRLDQPIEKDKIFKVMSEIKKVQVNAPVKIGSVLIEDIASTGSNIIATKNVQKRENYVI
ncbi:DUF1667 domain-containing protein [Muricomes intestini]|jgi:CxxC motif-containing protein|uniref:CxxC motif-containing protein n=1 Tax=Muricomes intestini TaxID=1796634 RepID=A0A4R3K489_9FIRM|nr:DUF1667 domain-containing protein [Muricomes intestini]TCS77543.1 CxxC motif-containing protein [Muricomes intestini]HAX50880.1 NAD(FAD)-dependent dehydrogenase [Lachnospiraceae bacterium]HCR84731.1 NAD(FAD)-dependent dehydrogenase [Lachnospiraceae bacterium]